MYLLNLLVSILKCLLLKSLPKISGWAHKRNDVLKKNSGAQGSSFVPSIQSISFSTHPVLSWKCASFFFSTKTCSVPCLGYIYSQVSDMNHLKGVGCCCCCCEWFEPRSISSSYSVIVRVKVVLKRTVVGDWHFDNPVVVVVVVLVLLHSWCVTNKLYLLHVV